MEAAPPSQLATCLGRPATPWRQTEFSKSVELPHGPINTPPTVEMRRHTTHFGDSTCKALILSVVARRRVVRRMVRV
jgi:hypothetical protein